jgi:hypothetical protein
MADEKECRAHERHPFASVVRDPQGALELPHALWIERPAGCHPAPALQVPGATSEIWFTSSTRAHAALAILLDRLFDPLVLQPFLRARRFPDLAHPSCGLCHARLEPQARRRLVFLALHVQPEWRVHRVVLVTVDTVEIKHESLANAVCLLRSEPQEL